MLATETYPSAFNLAARPAACVRNYRVPAALASAWHRRASVVMVEPKHHGSVVPMRSAPEWQPDTTPFAYIVRVICWRRLRPATTWRI